MCLNRSDSGGECAEVNDGTNGMDAEFLIAHKEM